MRRLSRALLRLVFLLLLLSVTGGCGEPGVGESCEAGTEGCPCAGGATCAGAGLTCAGGYCVVTDTCPAGSDGCACYGNGTCDAGLDCNPGVDLCVSETCAAGAEGCPCYGNATCDADLECGGVGLCAPGACPTGTHGCACAEGGACAEGLICGLGFVCYPAACVAGAEGCPCYGNGTCDPGLACDDNLLCAPAACPTGTKGCPCYGNTTCNQGLKCTVNLVCGDAETGPGECTAGTLGCGCVDDALCLVEGLECDLVDETCQSPDCPRGQPGCGCLPGGDCWGAYSCQGGICAWDWLEGPQPPADPKCYTPCRMGMTVDGNWLSCPADRLMPGCLDGYECVEGTCVCDADVCTPPPQKPNPMSPWYKAGELPLQDGPSACVSDLECPDWQTCVAGACYSVCELDNECSDGRVCHRHVCRQPCVIDEGDCPEGMFCETEDGASGHCMLLPYGEADAGDLSILGGFTLSESVLLLSPFENTAAFTLVNHAPVPVTFEVRKVHHVKYTANGMVTIDTNPLSWLAIGAFEGEAVQESYTVEVPGAGGEFVLGVGQANAGELDRWDGQLEVEGTWTDDEGQTVSAGLRRLHLHFRGSPMGRWSGTMVYFAQFPDKGLEDWKENKTSSVEINKLDNALLRRWSTFRKAEGDLSWVEFKAVLAATKEETWSQGSVASLCPPGAPVPDPNTACYLYVDPFGIYTAGVAVYSANLNETHIPTGATELPVAFTARPAIGGGATGWEGRIESRGTLHYAGDPELQFTFEASPTECQSINGNFGDCLTFIEDFEADIYVGGHRTAPGSADCDSDMDSVETTWLLGDFPPVSGGGVECRQNTLPFGAGADVKDVNTAFALSNPVANGLPLKRHLRLLDGALVNQEVLFILFEERFDLTIHEGSDGVRDCSSYGYMVLTLEETNIPAEDYLGNVHEDSSNKAPQFAEPTFSQELLDDVAAQEEDPDVADFVQDFSSYEHGGMGCAVAADPETCIDAVLSLARTALYGDPTPQDELEPIDEADGWSLHYFCEDTGLVDAGPTGKNDAAPCPPGAEVTYFAAWCDGDDPTPGTDSRDCFSSISCNMDSDLTFDIKTVFECVDVETGSSYKYEDKNDDPVGCDSENEHNKMIFDIVMDGNGDPLDPGTCRCWVKDRRQAALCAAGAGGAECDDYEQNGDPCESDADCASSFHCDPQTDTCVYDYRFDLLWHCDDDGDETVHAYCDDPWDLRDGKLFYWSVAPDKVLSDLRNDIDQAYRYKVKFVNRQGKSLGFAPRVCGEGDDLYSYCYDPDGIRAVRSRVDGLITLYTWFSDDILAADPELYEDLAGFLRQNFSYYQDPVTGFLKNGFERLYTELLVMMGDEAYTAAFAARFDVAGMQAASFPGADLEPPDGINLSGGAGYEMRRLYEATEYFDLALSRFYGLLPTLWQAFDVLDASELYLTQASVAHYMDRLVRASSHKARAWSEISKRYQNFGQGDLARRVVERAYTSTYLESIVFNEMMEKIMEVYANTADYAQVASIAANAQLYYRQALLEMRDVYGGIEDDLNYFGFTADYIPFPALEPIELETFKNGFDVLIDLAEQKLQTAYEKEVLAINSSKSFDVDVAAFEAELAGIRATYEKELVEICGSFEGDDGKIYPAVPRYADRSAESQVILQGAGTPCGLMGTGTLHASMVEVSIADLNVVRIEMDFDSLVKEIQYEKDRIELACDVIMELADYKYEAEGEKKDIQTSLTRTQQAIDDLRRGVDIMGNTFSILLANPIGAGPALAATYGTLGGVTEVATYVLQDKVVDKQKEISDIEAAVTYWETAKDCQLAKIDSDAKVKTLWLDLGQLEVDALKTNYRFQLALSRVQELRNKARILQDKMEEAEGHAINVMAAMNDPNIRIYKNDAIIAADRTFYRALTAAYKATRVYEYYTSTSYGHLGDLFLVRSVSHGDYTLEAYIMELEDAFWEFEEQYGNPDIRVKILSLRDDILEVPYQVSDLSCGSSMEQSNICSEENRVMMFRDTLSDPARVDANGYIVLPFSTGVADLSPLTRNHKIHYIEAELQGTDLGDAVARVYLRQIGTGSIRSLEGDNLYYAFPERTAVVDAWINEKVFTELVYKNSRLKDRPYANSSWELVLNTIDEPDNLDLGLFDGIRDIRLHIYYTDFTEL